MRILQSIIRLPRRQQLCAITAVLIALSCRVGGQSPPPAAPPTSRLEYLVDSICLGQMDSAGLPGLAVVIAKGPDIVLSKGYGFADRDRQVRIDPETHLFRIGSISKSVTAAALARLVANGKIDLDAPIATYLPGLPADKGALTLRQLGGHLAGIRHYIGFEFLSQQRYEDVLEPLDVFIRDTLLFEPGTKYAYSTYGWTLISAVMQAALNKPFLEIIREEVARPLGLTRLKADHPDSTHFTRPIYYQYTNGQLMPGPPVDNSNKWAGGGFICSAEDVARFGMAHLGSDFIPDSLLQVFTSTQRTADGEETNYGIGYGLSLDEKGRRWFGHSGGSVGGSSMMLIYPDEALVVVTLVNLSSARTDGLAWRLADMFRTSME